MQIRSKLVLAAAAALWCVACVGDPYDGKVVAQSESTVVPVISGWTTESTATVRIFAKRLSNGAWDEIASATPSTNTSHTWAGSTWFQWSLSNVNVAQKYWQSSPGLGGTATIKAATSSVGDYVSLNAPWSTCFHPTQTLQQFLDKCQASNSPEIRILNCGAVGCGGSL